MYALIHRSSACSLDMCTPIVVLCNLQEGILLNLIIFYKAFQLEATYLNGKNQLHIYGMVIYSGQII